MLILAAAEGISQRNDPAVLVAVSTSSYQGSLQNGSWSPDNQFIMCTNWKSGYNQYPADILLIELEDYSIISLTTDGESNVNMPGLTWNPVIDRVIFSSEKSGNGDQVHIMDPHGLPGSAVRISPWSDRMCWEPGFSPDGEWITYEAHYFHNPNRGIVETYKIDGTQGPFQLTDTNISANQPSWSPAGDKILYQAFDGDTWDIWTMDVDGSNKQNVTGSDPGDKTDATFSPDGKWIVYSADNGTLLYANIFIKNLETGQLIRVTDYSGYDGAPSWSTDDRIVFESTERNPDDSNGSMLWIINATVKGTTFISENNTGMPKYYYMSQNYPNPFNPTTIINYQLPVKGLVTLKIYDVVGREVAALVDGIQNAGYYNVTFNGAGISSGVYFYRLQAGTLCNTKKLLLMK
ncbi:MAG: PD40 domain-containing protein [Bacteroidetes bacterium]|nr:PD40 domain-containing protein [Bacteroidota bacterium]